MPSYPPTVIHEDGDLLVLAKPAGLATANAQRGQESVHSLLVRQRPPGSFVGIVSRIDAPVSGVLAVALTRPAAADLARQFRARRVAKTYAAVVTGRFPAPLGIWVDWHDEISRQPGGFRSSVRRGHASSSGGGRRADTDADAADAEDEDGGGETVGQPAHVQARVVARAGEASLVELRPTTGRRHQLRAQLAAHGCPIVGDRRYGARLPFPDGIALHARSLSLEHPRTGEAMEFTARWPQAWQSHYPLLLAAWERRQA